MDIMTDELEEYMSFRYPNWVSLRKITYDFDDCRKNRILRILNRNKHIFEHTSNGNGVGSGKNRLNLWRYVPNN